VAPDIPSLGPTHVPVSSTIRTPPTHKDLPTPVTELPLAVIVEPSVTTLELVVDETVISFVLATN
jgi:hypothetical protein